MTWEEQRAERFPDLTRKGEYQRLVALARRRLIGLEHHAEDVVSRAVMKWATIRPETRALARIEQIIKTEAYSLIRSERRARDRDTRAATDRALSGGGSARPHTDQEVAVFRHSIVEAIEAAQIPVGRQDLEVLELLLAGYSVAEITRVAGLSRYQVRQAQQRWRTILGALIEPVTEPTSRS